MSQETVDLIVGLQAAPDVDLARLFRGGATLSALTRALHPDFQAAFVDTLHGTTAYSGIDGLREAWLDWVSPWATYRTEIEDVLDLGERVLLLVRDYARGQGSSQEVMLLGAAIWTLRDGKIVRAEFYSDRSAARAAVGLEG